MPKILVLYYSMDGHIETMAGAIAEGARSVDGAEELAMARFQGNHVASIAKKLFG